MRREFGTADYGTALIGGRARARASERPGPCPLFTNLGPAESLRSGVRFCSFRGRVKVTLVKTSRRVRQRRPHGYTNVINYFDEGFFT